MTTFAFSDFGATTLGANVVTAPAAGTPETWTLASTLGNPGLPQITSGQQYTATVYATGDADPEIVLVTAILNSTQVTVQRGYNGIVKAHSVGDNFVNSIAAEWLNNPTAPTPTTGDNSTKVATTAFVETAIAGLGGGYTAASLTTVSGTTTLTNTGTPNIYPVLMTASATIKAPRAPLNSSDYLRYEIYENGTGGYTPTLEDNAGTAIVYTDGQSASWTTTAGNATVVELFPNEAGTDWVARLSAFQVYGYLPVQEPVSTLASSGTVQLALPVGSATVQECTQSGAITIANPTSTPGSGTSVTFQFRLVTDGAHDVTFPTTATRWIGGASGAGSAPFTSGTAPAAGTWDFTIKCLDNSNWDWTFVGRPA